jgi:hypothetical protein
LKEIKMRHESEDEQLNDPTDHHFTIHGEMTNPAAWTEIEPGRFMPRRVRGSFQGRALG